MCTGPANGEAGPAWRTVSSPSALHCFPESARGTLRKHESCPRLPVSTDGSPQPRQHPSIVLDASFPSTPTCPAAHPAGSTWKSTPLIFATVPTWLRPSSPPPGLLDPAFASHPRPVISQMILLTRSHLPPFWPDCPSWSPLSTWLQ